MKPIGAAAILIVGLMVLRKDPHYSLNQLFAASFLLFSFSQFFDLLKDVAWPAGYTAVVAARGLSIVTGVYATLFFLLTGINVRYGAHLALDPKVLTLSAITGAALSAVAMVDQYIAPIPDPLQLTIIAMGAAGSISLFVIPSALVLASTLILFSVYPRLDDPEKRKAVLLLASGVFVLVMGGLAYAVEGLFPPLHPARLILSTAGLIAWLVGALLCLLAFSR